MTVELQKLEKITQNEEKHAERRTDLCPTCGSSQVQHVGRCMTCFSCGWSACSM